MSKEPEVEYPRWVYPPDGGPGKECATPDDKPKGWLDHPALPGPASGERVIGQPDFTAGLTADELKEVETLERKVQADEADDESARKSKKK
jgi:hypothetical protein